MFEFFVEKMCPVIFLVVIVTAIDIPGNYFRTWMLELLNQVHLGHYARYLRF